MIRVSWKYLERSFLLWPDYEVKLLQVVSTEMMPRGEWRLRCDPLPSGDHCQSGKTDI